MNLKELTLNVYLVLETKRTSIKSVFSVENEHYFNLNDLSLNVYLNQHSVLKTNEMLTLKNLLQMCIYCKKE